MRNTTIGMAVAAVILMVLAYVQGGISLITVGLIGGGKMAIQVIPLLLVAFLVAGLIQVLVSKEMISKWLGKEAGFKGVILGGVAGALIPGGPYVYFPIAASFLMGGAEIGTVKPLDLKQAAHGNSPHRTACYICSLCSNFCFPATGRAFSQLFLFKHEC